MGPTSTDLENFKLILFPFFLKEFNQCLEVVVLVTRTGNYVILGLRNLQFLQTLRLKIVQSNQVNIRFYRPMPFNLYGELV